MSIIPPRRTALAFFLVGALAALGATALVTRVGDGGRAQVVCTVQAVLAPAVPIEPYGEVHVVDADEAMALTRGCAHAGAYELTPACELWHTAPRPRVVAHLDPSICREVRERSR